MSETEVLSMKKGVAELVGTFALLYIGILVLVVRADALLIEIAFAHGLIVATIVSAIILISGGQINPAVTLALLVGRKITPQQAGLNIAAQLVGGAIGGYLALASVPGGIAGGIPALAPDVSIGTGILVEAILTFFLVCVVFGTAVDPRFGTRLGGLAIGLTITAGILAGGPITGAALNPARWFGAAIAGGDLSNVIVYTIGPILGGVLAGVLYAYFLLEAPAAQPEPQAQKATRPR